MGRGTQPFYNINESLLAARCFTLLWLRV